MITGRTSTVIGIPKEWSFFQVTLLTFSFVPSNKSISVLPVFLYDTEK
jgi:hypothetical protein